MLLFESALKLNGLAYYAGNFSQMQFLECFFGLNVLNIYILTNLIYRFSDFLKNITINNNNNICI